MRQTLKAKRRLYSQRFAGRHSTSLTILRRAQKQRKTAACRPLPKRKIFSFLKLPAEIRNVIYTYALTDPHGINFVAVQRNRRRSVERVSQKTLESVSGGRIYYHPTTINDRFDDADDAPMSLVPSLLAVNKQIHQEACDILYSNELVFADPVALYAFMINLGPVSASRLRKIRLNGWGWGRTTKAYNNACFAVLIRATGLEKFRIDTNISWHSQPKGTAQQLYRDAFPWLEAVGDAKGKFDAALDILEVAEESLGRNNWNISKDRSIGSRKEFDAELSRNLSLQQKRVMAPCVKRSRKSKVSNAS